MRNLSFGRNNRTRSNDALELVYTDGNTIGSHGEKYFVKFIDDYSKFAMVYIRLKVKMKLSIVLLNSIIIYIYSYRKMFKNFVLC